MATIYDAFDTNYRVEYYGISVNKYWKENIARWLYYSDSFHGGNDYREGRYLTKYYMESTEEYESRIKQTPLDNHCKSVVETYNSFLFRTPPKREYGSIENDPALDNFFKDADMDGRSWDQFMRDVATQSSIYGSVWVSVDKPTTAVATRAEELQQEIRPYVVMFTPENVIDWEYTRRPSGAYELTFIKIWEGSDDDYGYYRELTPESISVYRKARGAMDRDSAELLEQYPNPINKVPCVPVYAQRSRVRGIGISDISDIADMQRAVYNELSELEQIVRISNHPSLVKTSDTQAAAGAGAIIDLPNDLEPNLKPYLLEPSGSGIENILSSLDNKANAINRMANLGGTRATATRSMSGVALETEFQILNARLSEKADLLELAEEQIWRMWALWQGQVWDGVVDYPDSFNIHDKANTIELLKKSKEVKPENPKLLEEIDNMLASALVKDDDRLAEIKEAQNTPAVLNTTMQHPRLTSATDMVAHMREMLEQGYSNEQIMELHPEISELFNNTNGGTDNG